MINQPTNGFDKSKRLLESRQYQRVLRAGKTERNAYFVMIALPNHSTNHRLGVTVSKKVSKKAVERNRIKRIIRETFRCTQINASKLDFVVIARAKAAKSDNQQLNKTLLTLWNRFI